VLILILFRSVLLVIVLSNFEFIEFILFFCFIVFVFVLCILIYSVLMYNVYIVSICFERNLYGMICVVVKRYFVSCVSSVFISSFFSTYFSEVI
jgi:hypothetical protein